MLEGSTASAQMLDIRTGSFTLPQAEILETMLKVAIKARLPIYKDGKVTGHFKIVYLRIVFSFHVSTCRFVSRSSGLSVFHCEAGSLTHGGRIGLKMKTSSASRMVGRMERFYFFLMRVLRDCFLLLSPELSLLILAYIYIYQTHFSAFLWSSLSRHCLPQGPPKSPCSLFQFCRVSDFLKQKCAPGVKSLLKTFQCLFISPVIKINS